jgi:CDP-glucose 4,6-dehydratase
MSTDLNSLKKNLDGPVLITGHTGFKGTWLTLLMETLGIEVHGLSLPPDKDSLYARLGRQGKIEESFADIRSFSAVEEFISNRKHAAVFHMAAQPLVIESYRSPLLTFETNVIGTANVFHAATKVNSSKAVIAITTDKVYRNENQGKLFKEGDPLAGKDPYSASKVGTESVVSAWQQISRIEGGPRFVSVRAGNVIGGGDMAQNRLIPDLIRGFSTQTAVKVRNPNSTRPWQHVLDPLIGYLMCLQKVVTGAEIESLNFGPTEPSLRVDKVVKTVQAAWGHETLVEFEEPVNRVYESSRLDLDSTLAEESLGWKPVWTQEEAIIQTTNWWKSILIQKLDPLEVTMEDIFHSLREHKIHEK